MCINERARINNIKTTSENIVAKGEIDEQFLLLPPCFQLYSILKVSFIDISIFCLDLFKGVCSRLYVRGKGINKKQPTLLDY